MTGAEQQRTDECKVRIAALEARCQEEHELAEAQAASAEKGWNLVQGSVASVDCEHSPTQGVGGVWECFKCGKDLSSTPSGGDKP